LRFRLELDRHVIIESQRRPHGLMLSSRHRDVYTIAGAMRSSAP
jgi:hypothetical protein